MAGDLQSSPAADFSRLRAEGIALLQRYAGETWTDHNAHDPGITILEQLCYALTDLVYRSQYALPDLLASGGADPYASLYTPAQILPSAPVTLDDLRKLVIDVRGVKNAWIDVVDEPAATYDAALREVSPPAAEPPAGAAPASSNLSPIRLKGLYRVSIERSEIDDVSPPVIRREATRRLHRYRPLCEDFQEITVLGQQPVALDITLEVDATQRAVVLLADVYERLAAYMSPAVPFRSLDEMLARGRRVDQVFDGPLLEHGFIDSQELAQVERRTTLRISDLIREVMAVPGVTAVKTLRFTGAASKDWLLTVEAGKTPQFDASSSRIRLERAGLAIESDGLRAAAQERFGERATQAASAVRGVAALDLRPAPGRDRNVAAYSSVLEQFPAVYGIGAGGLPESASPRRKAQAKQLKAYLLFFDQLLANHFAQLAAAVRLFSFHDATPASYFSQAVQDNGKLGLDELRRSRSEDHRALLAGMTEGEAPGVRRRNRFLDHLLARFGEHFREYALLRPKADGANPEERLADHKRAFLRDYPRLGRDRGTGFNYLAPSGDSAAEGNVSGLELALRRKLGVTEEAERFYVVEHILLRPVPGDANQEGALFRDAAASDPYSLQLSVVFPAAVPRYDDANFRAFAEHMVREETPAHLGVRVLWLEETAMQAFREAHALWRERWRAHRHAALEL